ncbi:MAG: hypothetical protein ABF298_09590 [Alteriqipengyuania sp.]
MAVFNLLVGFADHHRLDGRQEFRDDERRKPKGRAKLQGCTHVPTDDSTAAHPAGNAYLAPKTLNQIPDLPALESQRFVKAARTDRTH